MTLWTEFTSQPFTHPRIPYVAQAGYRLGAAPPHPPVRFDVTDFGVRGDDRHDSADAINRALAEAGRSGGGCVWIPPGRYLLEDVLRISHDDVVLRGAGSAKTTLVWRTPLEDLVGVSKSRYGGESSAWSWSGGLIWVCAAERFDRLTDDIKRGSWPREGWIDRGTAVQQHLAGVRLPARRGDFAVTVDRPDELKPGQRVVLLWHDCDQHSLLKHICGDVEAAADYPWPEKSKLLSYLPYAWPVRIERVSGSQVFLRQPLPLDIRDEWRIRLVVPDAPITGAGVEGLTVSLPDARMREHLRDRGFNGLAFQCAWDCWCRDVVIEGGENGLLLVSSKSVTVSGTSIVGTDRHHSYACREQSHDNLFQDFAIIRSGAPTGRFHHGINVEGLSSGNVWSDGRMQAGTFDSHRGLPFGNVRTNIDICNDGWMSGSGDAGPRYGSRFVHWNVSVSNGRAKGIRIDDAAPYSVTVGISGIDAPEHEDYRDFTGELSSVFEPACPDGLGQTDLYEAQRLLTIDREAQ